MSKLSNELHSAFIDHLAHELNAFYFYWAVSTKLMSLTCSYPGFAKYFQAESEEERGHAQLIINFLIKRGSSIVLPQLPAYQIDNSNPFELLNESLEKEKNVLTSLENLHGLGEEDIDVADFLEDMISEQQTAIAALTRKINEIEMLIADGQVKLGLYLYDRNISI